jgi:hypothetical protein
MPSRICVTSTPEITVLSACASVSELTPSNRAWSWSTLICSVFAVSIQSKLVFCSDRFSPST